MTGYAGPGFVKALPLPLRQQRNCFHGPSGRMYIKDNAHTRSGPDGGSEIHRTHHHHSEGHLGRRSGRGTIQRRWRFVFALLSSVTRSLRHLHVSLWKLRSLVIGAGHVCHHKSLTYNKNPHILSHAISMAYDCGKAASAYGKICAATTA